MTAEAGAAEPRGEAHVVVAEAMRALWRELRGQPPRPAPAARAGEPAAPPPPPRAAGEAEELALPSPWRVLRLRRDGARPLVFEGLRLLGRQVGTPLPPGLAGPEGQGATHAFELFLARSGPPVARLALLAPEGAALRPVHSLRVLAGTEDLAALLAEHDPARGLPLPADPADPGAGAEALAERLRADARALVRAALRAAPLAVTPEDGDPR